MVFFLVSRVVTVLSLCPDLKTIFLNDTPQTCMQPSEVCSCPKRTCGYFCSVCAS